MRLTSRCFLVAGLLVGVFTYGARQVDGEGLPSGLPGPAGPPAQPAAPAQPDQDVPAKGFVAGLRLDYSHSESGNLTDLVPSAGYRFPAWSLNAGLPVVFSSAAVTAKNASARGIGDVYGSVSYALERTALFWESSLTGSAPTGDRALGLGTGRSTWNWSNYIDHEFNRVTVFGDLGVGNGLSPSISLGASGLGRPGFAGAALGPGRLARPYSVVGKLAFLTAGADIEASSAVTLSVSAYDIVPWGAQTAVSRFAVRQPSPAPATGSRSRKGQRFFDVSTLTTGSAALTRDHGFEAAVTVSPTNAVDVTASYSRSIPLQLDIVGVSLSLRWRSASRPAQPRPQ